MSIIRHRIDSYSVKIYGTDLDGSVARWATKEIHLFSGGRNVASAYFARPGHVPPDATLSGDRIIFNAPDDQYAPVLDLLRHEKAVFIAWVPHSDRGEQGDGNAVIFTGAPHPNPSTGPDREPPDHEIPDCRHPDRDRGGPDAGG